MRPFDDVLLTQGSISKSNYRLGLKSCDILIMFNLDNLYIEISQESIKWRVPQMVENYHPILNKRFFHHFIDEINSTMCQLNDGTLERWTKVKFVKC